MTVSATPTKTVSICGAILILIGSTAQALPIWPHQQAEAFATCSGRFSALATHLQSHRKPGAKENLELKAEFDLMLEAVLPYALEEGVTLPEQRRWRSAGWGQIAALLADVSYGLDQSQIERATNALEFHIQDCRDLLL
ncbi:hypothetical protein [Shimia abyssi]|uniref:Uncharacterized protein n=1 Tax=Shimia abyssi TaxID=1662395 RepID=A0A2P8FJL6_9RHOB|nr:hypothetical protein [Shimia abyssi]PSL21916.1 hypothetical protein CLV88_101340 [Shimia abyssi]